MVAGRRLSTAALGLAFVLWQCVHVQRSWYLVHNCDERSASGWAAPRSPARVSHQGFQEVFATLFALEMQDLLGIKQDGPLPPMDGKHGLADVTRTIKEQGVGILFISVKWFFQQPTPDTFDFRVMDYLIQTVCSQDIKLSIVLDAQANPPWVFDLVPDAGVVDSKHIGYRSISFNHPAVNQLVHAWYDAVLSRMVELNATCIHSVQPCFNNEYETKYIQEADGAQDYSDEAVTLFRRYLRSIHGSLEYWNERWGTAFTSWTVFQPPSFFQHGVHWDDTATKLFYWDWQHFRHRRIHEVHESGCMHIAAYGMRCIQHFAEFMTGSDAIYAAGSVFTLAASPWLDYIVVDSNFLTTAMLPSPDVRLVQLLLSAMKPFGKPVFFEGAFERISDPAVHRKAVQLTAMSGAHGIGFTNWLDRVGPTFFNDTLSGLPSPSADAPPVAILSPYRSFWAFKGAPKDADGVLRPTDPQQDRLFECLDTVEKAVESLDGLQIFGVPSMLLPVLQDFQQVWYMQPDVLLSGDAQAINSIKQRAAAFGLPFHVCAAKSRMRKKLVLPECCPSV